MLKKGLIFTMFLIALQCLFISTASAQTTIDWETAVIDSAVTWDEANSPYIITEDVRVETEGSLTIQPGVVVKFNKQKGLNVYGTLNAQGTADKHIFFTDSRDDAAGGDTNSDGGATAATAGYWAGINVSGTATMDYCDVRYAGYYYEANIYKTGTEPLTLTNSTLSYSSSDSLRICYSDGASTVNNCTFNDNKRYGVFIEDIETDSYTGIGNSFANNSKAPVCIEGGTLKHDITWNKEGSPYYIAGDVTVDDNAVLTVDPNVVVKFAQSKGLSVKGTLTAKGTPTGSESTGTIYFTDYKDDAAGDDTNGDGVATKPAPGWWVGINLRDSGTATLDNCVVRYGGYYYDSNIYKTGIGALSLTNSEISNSMGSGLSIHDNTGACTITKNKIYSNKVGITCEGSNPVIGGSLANANKIYQNTNFGLENKSDNTINAKYNWWGDDTGPTHDANPLGKGDKASDYVDFGNFLSGDNDPDPTPVIVVFDPKTNILPNKIWTIKFNQNIYDGASPNSTVNNQNITVIDDQNNPINVTISQGNDLRSVIIEAPAGGYMSGKTYTIWVKNVQNVNEKIINKQYNMKFTIS